MTSENANMETFENAETESTSNIAEVLHFDPFKSGEEIPEASSNPAAKTPEPDKAAAGGNEQGNNAPSPKGDTPPNPVLNTEVSVPKTDVDQGKAWQAIAEAALAVNGSKANKEEVKQDDPNKAPEYDFELPDKLIEALSSQDPNQFKVGLTAFAKGVANAVHQQMYSHLQKVYNPRFESMPEQIMSALQAKTNAKAIHDDFYGKYPEFNKEPLKPVIKQIAEQVAKDLNITDYNEKLRDAIALKARELFGIVAQPANNNNKPPVPPKMLSAQGSRVAPNTGDAASKEITDLLFTDD